MCRNQLRAFRYIGCRQVPHRQLRYVPTDEAFTQRCQALDSLSCDGSLSLDSPIVTVRECRPLSGMFPHPSHTPVMIPVTAPFARTATLTAWGPKKRPSRTPSVPNVAAKVVAPGAKLV